MSEIDPQTALTVRFADGVWERPGIDTGPWQAAFAAEAARLGVTVRRVCEAQTDETLALAFLQGVFRDTAFTELLVYRYGPKMRGWFARHGRLYGRAVGEELADELVQETWFRLFASGLGHYDSSRVFSNFLFVATRNLFLQKVVRPKAMTALADRHERVSADSVAEDVEFREMGEHLETAMGHLPAAQSGVLRFTLEGQDPPTIALTMGILVRDVYRHLFQARRAVERELAGQPRRLGVRSAVAGEGIVGVVDCPLLCDGGRYESA